VNNSFVNQIEDVFDVQKQMKELEARHPRMPVLPSGDVDKIIAVLEGTKIRSFSNMGVSVLKDSPWTTSIISIVIITACLTIICCFLKGWIRCPLIRMLPIPKIQIQNKQKPQKEQDIDLYEYYQQQLSKKQQEVLHLEC
jgi:hypothetical protein